MTSNHPSESVPSTEHAQRASRAADSILSRYTRRVFGVPGTLLGAVQMPESRGLGARFAEWHYWWQAHLLDCIIDAGERAVREGDTEQAQNMLATARSVVRGIHTRNLGFANDFYDDMAWLALAVGRLNRLSKTITGASDVTAQDAGSVLFERLNTGLHSCGGMSWSKGKRDFCNTPATAPAALAFARIGQIKTAQNLMSWLNDVLWDGDRMLYFDGANLRPQDVMVDDVTGRRNVPFDVERNIYTYNQGTTLAVLLTLAESSEISDDRREEYLLRAERLIVGIVKNLSEDFEFSDGSHHLVLHSGSDGDGALFTGILVRYLAQAAMSTMLSPEARSLASALVYGSARAVWEGRREFDPTLPLNEPGIDPNEIRDRAVAIFSPKFTVSARDALAAGKPVELSGQLQAWMTLEAAAHLSVED